MIDLTGKRAVVTGGSRGIGQEIAIGLARAGCDVASFHLADPDNAAVTEAGIVGCGGRAMMVEGDVAVADEVELFAGEVAERWGGIDIWVNNASCLLVQPFLEMADADFHALMGSNLFGYYHGCRSALRVMIRQKSGSIINITSVTDLQPIAGLSAYITAKGGIVAMTRALALEFAPAGVRVNAIAPGAIETPLTAHTYTPEIRAAYDRRIAKGRVGRPGDIVGAALFLASDLSDYVYGQELVVDGGLSINGNI